MTFIISKAQILFGKILILPPRLLDTKNYSMKRIFILLLVSVYTAQGQDISIKWNEPTTNVFTEQSFDVLSFEGASYTNGENPIPEFCTRIQLNSWDVDNIRLTNIIVKEVSSNELAILNRINAEDKFVINGGVAGENGSPYLSLCVASVRYNLTSRRYEKLISATVAWGLSPASFANKTNTFGSNSVLANGSWYKVSVANNGIYKITPSYLQEIGLGIGVQISGLAVFGNGMGELPERNNRFRYDDLQENGTFVLDQNQDGVFNGNDYLLFYGRASKQWSYDYDSDRFNHLNNNYSENNYYFVTTTQGSGKRVGSVSYNPGTPTHTVTSFDDHQFYELDKTNLLGTGRRWFGELFDFQLSYNFNFGFPNIDVNEPVKIFTRAVARSSSSSTRMNVSTGGLVVSDFSFGAIAGSGYVSESSDRAQFVATSSNVALTVSYNNNLNPSSIAWLDYIEVVAKRNLVYTSDALLFRDSKSVGPNNVAEYKISNYPSTAQIWDVTSHLSPQLAVPSVQGNEAVFKAPADSLREFIVLNGSSFSEPGKVGPIANQDLHGMSPVDFVIVSHKNFLSEANKLAEFHRTRDNYRVAVIELGSVYNEFSSGAQDITAIKDLMRNLYEKAQAPEDKPTYLLLFGDASYDYKNRIDPNHNFVPVYQSPASFSYNSSYSTDDFFGFLDPSEGGSMYSESLDLSIGRFPVKTVSEARVAVDKIINYTTSTEAFGSWRNSVLMVTDDVDAAWERSLTITPELKSRQLETRYPALNFQKIYTDAYIQSSSAGSQRYPEAREELFRKVAAGNLMTLYVGHGGEVGWATERVLQLEDINAWDNIVNMPVFVTITCEFSRLDDPKRVSAGEQLFNNNKGGTIALFSTTRAVGSNSALNLNNIFLDTVFARGQNGAYQKMGDVIRNTKNQAFGDDKLKFSLLGDPALQMAIPEYQVVNTHINGVPMGLSNDTIKALSKVSLKGEVRDLTGAVISDFQGSVFPNIFDKKVAKQTLLNDGQGSPVFFQEFENTIYRGEASVQNGLFEYEFIVPLDISYNVDYGKLNYYADNNEVDAHGSATDILVGGLNTNAAADKVGPDIELFINDRSFVSGGITNSSPVIYVEVFDSSGINTVGNGIGHDIIAVLDDNTNNTFVLNDYYDADLNSFQSGKIQYPLQGLEPGEHKLLFRVWDVYNNPSETVINFIVSESSELQISRVLNWPNPFTTYTEFQFEHNRASEPLDVQVQIFSVSGQIIKSINQRMQATGNRVTGISWDGRDQYGDQIAKGVYVYKLKVKSQLDNAYAEKIEKLVILR